jgi:NAD(P)H-dependent FMN reductase
MSDLKIIVGSTRDGRMSDRVMPWLLPRVRAHGGFDVEVLDLRVWSLPLFQETLETIGDPLDPVYSDPVVRKWNAAIQSADAFVIVTPEYNHSVPGVLKNAIDNVFVSFGFRHKPVGFVGYSTSPVGAGRCIEHLVQVMSDAEAVPVRNTVLIGNVHHAIADGQATSPATDIALQIMLDDVAWWAEPLKEARAAGELPPGPFRLRDALAQRA